MRHSLRSRLLFGVIAATLLILAASSLTVYALMRASLFAEFDAALGSKARALAALVEQEGGEIEMDFQEVSLPEFRRADRPEYLQCWHASGEFLYRSPRLEGHDLGREAGSLEDPLCRSATLPDGRRGRVAGLTFVPRQEHKGRGTPVRVTLAIARDTQDIDRTLARLKLLLIAVCAAATVVSASVLAWIVKAGLRPAERLAGQIGSVGEDDLSARIAVDDAPAELLPVVDRLNELLARLKAAFEREKAFSADVAHELRTPLAGLRTTLEVALTGKRGLAPFEEALHDSLAISCQMHAMVENLLAMARCEAGQLEVARESVRVDEVLQECWSQIEGLAAQRELRLQWQVAQPCPLETDRGKLRLILLNILRNAVSYASTRGYVRVQCRPEEDGRVVLSVSNSGSQLSEEQAGHVFERFWRGDASRSATGVHCGLGLALCERLTVLLAGSISVHSDEGGEFTVALEFGPDASATPLDAEASSPA